MGKTPEQYTFLPTLPGPKQTLIHYRKFQILLKNGTLVDMNIIRHRGLKTSEGIGFFARYGTGSSVSTALL